MNTNWKCPNCGYLNEYYLNVCICGERKPGIPPPESRQALSDRNVGSYFDRNENNYKWKCPRCNHNNDITLFKCSCGHPIGIDEQKKYWVDLRVRKDQRIEKNDSKLRSGNVKTCPHCDEIVSESTLKCPYCAENIKDYQISNRISKSEEKETSHITITKNEGEPYHPQIKSVKTKQPYEDELEKKLTKLRSLLKNDIISDDEFKTKREQLINDYLDK